MKKSHQDGRSRTVSIEIGKPVPSRATCVWHVGFNSELVIEEWARESSPAKNDGRIILTIAPRKVIVYRRNRPSLRFVEVRGELENGKQKIKHRSIEFEGDFRLHQILRDAKPLLDELCKVERRGRPKGKKKSVSAPVTPSSNFLRESLDRLSLKPQSQEYRELMAIFREGNLARAARSLGMKEQTLHKRFLARIEPALKTANPAYDRAGFRAAVRELARKNKPL